MTMPLLTLLVLVPLGGGLLVLLTGRDRDALARQLALAISLVTFAISIFMWMKFDSASPEFLFVETHRWLPDFGIKYHVGVDGISMLLVVLSTFLTEQTINLPALFMGAAIAVLPLVVIFIVAQRNIVQGVTASGIKG